MTEQQLIDEGYTPALARIVYRVLKDIQKVNGFEIIKVRPWKSNLGKIMPNIGDRIETEIRNYIEGQEIILLDQRRRELSDAFQQIKDEHGNQYISKDWIDQNIKNKLSK